MEDRTLIETEWKYYPDQCGECGADVEVYTEQTEEGWVNDGDPVRCIECGAKGQMVVNDIDDVYIDWHEESEVEG